MAYKHFVRELLGLAIVVSVVFGVLGVMLELFALTALWEHQQTIADVFFHESLYFIVFLIPPYFLWKLINRPELVSSDQAYLAMKLEAESRQ
ncbi:D-fructose-6-phosphate amidotransferase [Vibrio alginolyticus]|uniref:D-fructose-6-phosphate amidotransferase n=1 Tax=Vibrio alginolyticus TaxID=663 RepID=UPI001BD55E11|nr:D-fructose-6-phosphate amidotransferase [Vibrio alginolyticus]MBT0033558.1 D-fructose-6-phosphate amidotransferase [Vibrio alginolyticus]